MNEAIDDLRLKLPIGVVAASDGSKYWKDSSSSHFLMILFIRFLLIEEKG